MQVDDHHDDEGYHGEHRQNAVRNRVGSGELHQNARQKVEQKATRVVGNLQVLNQAAALHRSGQVERPHADANRAQRRAQTKQHHTHGGKRLILQTSKTADNQAGDHHDEEDGRTHARAHRVKHDTG